MDAWLGSVDGHGLAAVWDQREPALVLLTDRRLRAREPLREAQVCVIPPLIGEEVPIESQPDDGCPGDGIPARSVAQINAISLDDKGRAWYVVGGVRQLLFTQFDDADQ